MHCRPFGEERRGEERRGEERYELTSCGKLSLRLILAHKYESI
jgi:hypothetical protein